jgi:hypothetical protein
MKEGRRRELTCGLEGHLLFVFWGFFFVFFLFWQNRVLNSGPCAWALYLLSHTLNPFGFGYFSYRVSHLCVSRPGPWSTSGGAGMTGMPQHPAIGWDEVSRTICPGLASNLSLPVADYCKNNIFERTVLVPSITVPGQKEAIVQTWHTKASASEWETCVLSR